MASSSRSRAQASSYVFTAMFRHRGCSVLSRSIRGLYFFYKPSLGLPIRKEPAVKGAQPLIRFLFRPVPGRTPVYVSCKIFHGSNVLRVYNPGSPYGLDKAVSPVYVYRIATLFFCLFPGFFQRGKLVYVTYPVVSVIKLFFCMCCHNTLIFTCLCKHC